MLDDFFKKIEPPVGPEDAQIKMYCHAQTVEDIDLQLEINELELDLLNAIDKPLPYHLQKIEYLEEHRLKLYWGKKFHMNARDAYWYYLTQFGKQ